jgi:glutamate racemase
LPYGNKSPDTIAAYCIENISFLIDQQIKILVVACHTACTAALDRLRETFDLPIIGIMEQGIEETVLSTHTQKIAILGTRTTIASGVYQHRIQEHCPSAKIYAIACPLFVPLIEEGYIDHPIATLVVKEYLHPLKDKEIDTLLLGCTHYPLLQHLLQQELGSSVAVIDPALRCARQLRRFLEDRDLLNCQTTLPQYTFYVSDDPEKFRSLGKSFLLCPIKDISCIRIAK